MAETEGYKLTQADADDLNMALSLVLIGSSIEQPHSVDEAVHLRNLCAFAADRLSNILQRVTPDGIEIELH